MTEDVPANDRLSLHPGFTATNSPNSARYSELRTEAAEFFGERTHCDLSIAELSMMVRQKRSAPSEEKGTDL